MDERKEKYDPLLKKTAKKTDDEKRKEIFNLYISKEEVGKKMLTSFMNLDVNKNADGFVLKKGASQVGLISQCYGIITLAEYSKFNLDLGEYASVSAKINASFNDVLNRIHADSDQLVFDATPYVSEDANITSYTESVALVLRVAIEVRRLLVNDFDANRNTIEIDDKYINAPQDISQNERTEKEIAFIESLITKCLDRLTGSVLKIDDNKGTDYYLNGDDTPLLDNNGVNMKYKGWTFTEIKPEAHKDTDISLYFTYTVSDAYLAFYENFENSIRLVRELRNKIKESGADVTLENADEKEYELGEDLQAFQERDFHFIKRIYRRHFYPFNKAMLDAGHYVDTYFSQIDTTKDFFSYNFNLVTAQNIEEASSSDAMFNVLFAINIMMASGVDMDYASRNKEIEFYDRLQYTIPNVQRLYKKLIRQRKEYVCEQYMIKVNENLPNDVDCADSVVAQARAVRKQNIVACNLMPAIIKTYNVSSKFLTPYPQYEMRIFKDNIIENKMNEEWLWDKDGYQLTNNFNYVYALRNFYDYYEKFEEPFAMKTKDYIAKKDKELADKDKELADKDKEITRKLAEQQQHAQSMLELLRAEYENKIAVLEEENAKLEIRKAPVVKEIESIIEKYLAVHFDEALINSFNTVIRDNGRRVRDTDDLPLVFKRAILSYLDEAYRRNTVNLGNVDEAQREAFAKKYTDIDGYVDDSVMDAWQKSILTKIQ